MRCAEFRDLHCAYVDDTLAGVELVRMQRHLAECSACAAMDARVRRSLMAIHALPLIEPSAEFTRRLDARLAECRAQRNLPPTGASFRTVAAVGALASLAMLAYMGEALHAPAQQGQGRDIVLPPVFAAAPVHHHAASDVMPVSLAAATAAPAPTRTLDTGATAAPAIVASVAAGVPIWPVGLLTEQGTAHLASFTDAR